MSWTNRENLSTFGAVLLESADPAITRAVAVGGAGSAPRVELEKPTGVLLLEVGGVSPWVDRAAVTGAWASRPAVTGEWTDRGPP